MSDPKHIRNHAQGYPDGQRIDRRICQKDGKEMLRIPAGEFLYGEHKQRLSLPEFWIDRVPVTNAEFARFVQETGYQTAAERSGIGALVSAAAAGKNGKTSPHGLAAPRRPGDGYRQQGRSPRSAGDLGRHCGLCPVGGQAAAGAAGMGKGGAWHGWADVSVGGSSAIARVVQFR